MNPRPLGPEPRRGKAKCARTFHSESTLLRCLPLLFPNVCCASVREPSQISALGSGTQEVGSQNLRNNQKRKQAKSCSRFWSRRRDLRLWRRAPVNSAPRCSVAPRPAIFKLFTQTARSRSRLHPQIPSIAGPQPKRPQRNTSAVFLAENYKRSQKCLFSKGVTIKSLTFRSYFQLATLYFLSFQIFQSRWIIFKNRPDRLAGF